MIIFPAVDILNGKCARLHQGKFDNFKIYFEDPLEAAQNWEKDGAEFLHIVDLNGALTGSMQNIESIERISSHINIPIQLGGGIRDMVSLEKVISLGIKRAVLGTSLIIHPEFAAEAAQKYGNNIAAAIDAKDGRVAIAGWREKTEYTAAEVVEEMKIIGIRRVIYTDILSDGTQTGINFESTKDLASKVDLPIIASGGVSSLNDIQKLKELEPVGVEGVIIGTALYEKRFTLEEAIATGRS